MNTQCQTCNKDWPDEILIEVELFDEEENKIVAKIICPACLEEFEQNDLELEQGRIFEPKNLISLHLLVPGVMC